MSKRSAHNNNQLRIIAGKWRGRKLQFPSIEGLRPTADSVRETLFNWLAPDIVNAHCLDCFAGSGALGFEALSRGATSVLMLDSSRDVINGLLQNAEKLEAESASIIQATFPYSKIILQNKLFDIVFIDPPFNQNLVAPCCQFLEKNAYLEEGALIYIETERRLSELILPENWRILRQKKTKQTAYYLAIRESL